MGSDLYRSWTYIVRKSKIYLYEQILETRRKMNKYKVDRSYDS
jgi:hypothetical protein